MCSYMKGCINPSFVSEDTTLTVKHHADCRCCHLSTFFSWNETLVSLHFRERESNQESSASDHPADSETSHRNSHGAHGCRIFYLQLVASINVCFICLLKWPYNFLSLNFKMITWLMNEIQSSGACRRLMCPASIFLSEQDKRSRAAGGAVSGGTEEKGMTSAGWIMNPNRHWVVLELPGKLTEVLTLSSL